MRKAVGNTERFAIDVRLHQESASSPHLFALIIDVLGEEDRLNTLLETPFANNLLH